MPAAAQDKHTRADQRQATRARLIDATFECLVERGYGGTTTALVAQRAGVSHGALFNHFGSREDLMVVCINDVFPRFLAEGAERLLSLVDGDPRSRPIAQVVNVLWDLFSGPTMQAMRELMIVARTNEALSAALGDLDDVVQQTNLELAAVLLPDLADSPDLPALLSLTLAAIDGAVFSSQAFRRPTRHLETRTALVHALELLAERASTAEELDLR